MAALRFEGRRADVFCRVVDNLGDAGVCWRLCRQLAGEYGFAVSLVIDAADVLLQFAGVEAADRALLADGRIRLLDWSAPPAPGDLVIETFGCEAPSDYVAALAGRLPAVPWYNLEYLSAEDWVTGCHRLPSPHPHWPLTRIFFFPGFVAGTGGLLRERDLPPPEPWQGLAPASMAAPVQVPASVPAPVPAAAPVLRLGLFCYAHPALDGLLAAFERGPLTVACQVFQGPAQEQVRAWAAAHPGHRTRFTFLPWLGQAGFDQVLRSCDLNVVRGEDSFVRAQWAGRPFCWDIYPQSDGAHLVKMAAFLRCYRAGLADAAAGRALGSLWQAWVGREEAALTSAWTDCCAALPALQAHAMAWRAAQAARPDLVSALLDDALGRGLQAG